MSELVSALLERQRALGLSDELFARRLTISQSMWHLVRTGKRRPGRAVLRGVLDQYPELASLHLRDVRAEPVFLPRVMTDRHASVTRGHEEEDETVPA